MDGKQLLQDVEVLEKAYSAKTKAIAEAQAKVNALECKCMHADMRTKSVKNDLDEMERKCQELMKKIKERDSKIKDLLHDFNQYKLGAARKMAAPPPSKRSKTGFVNPNFLRVSALFRVEVGATGGLTDRVSGGLRKRVKSLVGTDEVPLLWSRGRVKVDGWIMALL
ncbi:hypothetical protein AAMO2058_000406600 [Amorphochlora amoebiformis]